MSVFNRFSSRSGGTAGWGGGGFCSADPGGTHRNLPSSLSAGSPPTPPERHNTTEEEFGLLCIRGFKGTTAFFNLVIRQQVHQQNKTEDINQLK